MNIKHSTNKRTKQKNTTVTMTQDEFCRLIGGLQARVNFLESRIRHNEALSSKPRATRSQKSVAAFVISNDNLELRVTRDLINEMQTSFF
jgi:hypothetical protein